MKIQLVSDLHMEFSPTEITNAGANVLILAGDICVAEFFKRGDASPKRQLAETWRVWFENVCAQFENVIYVLGNHEHYHGHFNETFGTLRANLGHIANLHILDNDYLDIGSVRFVGGTLWTDFSHDNFKAMLVRDGLNDYSLIKTKGYKRLTTGETAFYHANFLAMIARHTEQHGNLVVVGHHAPSYRSVHERFANGRYAYLNPGYASHLDNFILNNDKEIKLWVHGHTHDSFDYEIGNTRIVCNPRGYQSISQPAPENEKFNPNLVVEI